MENIQVRVKYARTYNLGDYHNVRPEVELSCDVERLEDYGAVIERLLDEARGYVESAIDDALEKENLPPDFYDGPRYCYIEFSAEPLLCIYRRELHDQMPQRYKTRLCGYRLEWLEQKFAGTKYDSAATFYVHHDRDIARLPEIADLVLFSDEHAQEAVLGYRGEGPWLEDRFTRKADYINRNPRSLVDQLCREYPDYQLVSAIDTDVPNDWLAASDDDDGDIEEIAF